MCFSDLRMLLVLDNRRNPLNGFNRRGGDNAPSAPSNDVGDAALFCVYISIYLSFYLCLSLCHTRSLSIYTYVDNHTHTLCIYMCISIYISIYICPDALTDLRMLDNRRNPSNGLNLRGGDNAPSAPSNDVGPAALSYLSI